MPRKAKLIEIPAIAPLDRQAGSLSRQLSQALRAAVRQGKLQAGDALPSTRALAAALRLSRGTVSVAYDQLIAEGIDVDAGRMMAPDARAAFVTPSHQYPLGMPMSMAQRTALLGWAQAHNAWIVEDDYDSEMRYDGHPFPALQGQDPARVIYLGTFSKVLFPSLRLYAIVPPALVGAFCGARILMDRHPPNADQYVLAQFMAEGHLARHLRRMRSLYAEKRRVVIDAVSRHIAAGLAELQPCDQGMHMVLWLRRGLDDRHIERLAQEAGVSVRALSPMYAAGHGRSGLILGLGGYGDRQVEQAVITLNQLLQTAQNLRR